MPKCPHCNGTGQAPIKLKQECVACQRKLSLTFKDHDEFMAFATKDGLVYCDECKKIRET